MATIFFDTSTALAASATFAPALGGAIGFGGNSIRDATAYDDANRFGAVAHSDQSGTLYIDGTFDPVNGPWRQCGSIAVTPGVPADLDVPVRFRYYRVRYVNGTTATGAGAFAIHSSFRSGQ